MKKKSGIVAMLVVFIMILGTLAGCSTSSTSSSGASSADKGNKMKATVILVLKDKSEVKYDLNVTSGSSLRNALHEAKLINEETYGAMFVENIDGHIANTEKDGCTWLPCDKNGKQIQGTFDQIVLKDGETLYLKYFKVPDQD